MQQVEFTVRGRPISKGSMRSFAHKTTGKVVTIHDNKRSRQWQKQIAQVAAFHSAEPWEGPVELHLIFSFKRPKSAPGREYPTVRPDLDKLARAVLDALTGVIYKDDSQVVGISAQKIYGTQEGVEVQIKELSED